MSVVFGSFIVVTSILGIIVGTQSFNGWLAILYGLLGVSMGVAGIIGVWAPQPVRDALFGWFLVGLASRAILDGTVYLLFISVPIAVVLIAAQIVELLSRPSVARTLSAIVGGALAVLSLVVLAFAASYLPAICPGSPTAGRSMLLISYPPSTPPWDSAQQKCIKQCLSGLRT